MNRNLPMVAWLTAIITGALTAFCVTWIGDEAGAILEGVTHRNLRSWEFAAIQVSMLNVAAGMFVALAGAVSRRWTYGLAIGTVAHAVLFAIFLFANESFRAAPAGVNAWALCVGILGGACAGVVGGSIGQLASRHSSRRISN